jgi:putative protease
MTAIDTATTAPELLAPAGDWDALRAAVANGADAVYFGLDQFNARHRATNFTLAQLPEVMDYLHSHNVKGFLTFNTLIFSDELESAADYVKAVAAAGVDAVIVQDLGVADLIHTLAPTLAIHGSTQMTLTEPSGIEFVRQLGVERVVLARELSVKDIAKIAAATTMPLEVFVHGALCVSYSGQCLTSESFGGRSANRGQCAQACRLPYQLIVDGQVRDLGDKAYLLSPSDLAAHSLIADLTSLGVASFKIEGRLKSAHYVAATCQTYRAAIDAATHHEPFAISAEKLHDLEQTFSRGFTPGFLNGVNHQTLVEARSPKSRGTKVGTVVSLTLRAIVIQLDARYATSESPLKPGDGVVFDEGHPDQDEQGGRLYFVKTLPQNRLELSFREGDLNLHAIPEGALVWKTDDPALKRRLEHSYSRDEIVHRTPIVFTLRAHVGEHLTLTAKAEGRTATATWDEKVLEKANKFPLSQDAARDQLGRLGDTPFELQTVTLDAEGSPMVPKSVLNDLRRQVTQALIEQRARAHGIANPAALETLRAALPSGIESRNSKIENALHVLVRTLDQLDAVLSHQGAMRASTVYADFEDVRRYPEAVARCRAARIPIALATLRIVKPGEEGFLKQVADCQPDGLLIRHLGALHYYQQKFPQLPLIGDYALNVANELTANLFAKTGLVRMVPSYDLNWKQLAALLSRFDPSRFETVIHQHMPMFHMEHCVFAHTLSNGKDFRDCGRPCEKHTVDLTDRVGEPHPLVPDVGCRNTLFNAQAQTAAEFVPDMQKLGLRHFRVELLRESASETNQLLDRYTRVLAGLETPATTLHTLRVLNQLGVTRGTLVHE